MATPRLLFPINSQFPPVARVFQYFSFTFSELTFASDGSALRYRLEGAPAWLHFDEGARMFHGTPSMGDVGEILLKLHVVDSTGHLDHEVKFVTSAFAAATVGDPIGAQLSKLGRVDTFGGLILAQNREFNFSFAQDTFYGRDKIKRYNAVCSNNTPLPSWISFDGEKLEFYGHTPPLGSQDTPPYRFGLKLIAEDFPDFEGSSAAFEIVVNHHLVVSKPDIRLNVTIGKPFFYRLPLKDILLDDKPIKKTHIRGVTASVSEWIQFNEVDLTFTGSPASVHKSETVTLEVHDTYDNEAELNVTVIATWGDVFTLDLTDVEVARGDMFELSLNSAILDNTNLNINVTLTPPVNWISFDPESIILSGEVPMEAEDVQVEIIAENTASGHTETRTFDVVIKNFLIEDGKGTTTENGDDISNFEVGTTHEPQPGRKLRLILLSTLLPVAGAILILVCLTFRKWFVNGSKRKKPGQRSGTPTCDMISRPVHTNPTSEPWPVAVIPKKENKYTPVAERGFTGPGFVGVAPTSKKHTKDNSVGSDLLMRVGTGGTGIGSAITTDDDTFTPNGSFGDIPRRLTSIPMLTKIVSGEPLKVPSTRNGNDQANSKHWAPLGTDSGESIPGEGMTSSTRRSWRRTLMWAQRGGPRDSDATVDTVSTAEVFSVRLVGSPIIIGDRGETKQWQPRGLRKEDSPKDRFNSPSDGQQKEQKGKHVYFGDEWEITELPTPEQQHYIPRPSPRAAQRSLQRYRDSRASFGSEPFDDFSFAPTPASPVMHSGQSNSMWTALVQGKVRELGSGLRNHGEQKAKMVEVKKDEVVGKVSGKAYGWPF